MAKKAIISTGGKQYVVAEGDTVDIELISEEKTVNFEPLLVIDGDKVSVGTPSVDGAKVTAQVVAQDVKDDKVIAIRYKAKKRVRKIRGHRQRHTQIKITKIA
jgi:large subunit ribosomal protein L21